MRIILNTSVDDLRSSLRCNASAITPKDLKKAMATELLSPAPRTTVLKMIGREFRKRVPRKKGVCRKCGCSQFRPCINHLGETCSWTDRSQTLCNFCTHNKRSRK